MIKQRPSSCAHPPSPFQSPNLLPSLSVAVKYLFLLLPEILLLTSEITRAWNCTQRMPADVPTLNSAVLAQFGIFFQLALQKHLCLPLSSLGLITVTRSSQAALNIFENYKRSKTQLPGSSSKLINEIMFHPFSELFTGCPSKHVLNISCQHYLTHFFLIQPPFICPTFSMPTLYQDSSAPPLTQELYAFRT